MRRQVLPQAPSPTMTSFRRSSDMVMDVNMCYAEGEVVEANARVFDTERGTTLDQIEGDEVRIVQRR